MLADINECLDEPCANGQCLDAVDGYMCHCFDGYTGTNCDIGNISRIKFKKKERDKGTFIR